VSDAPNPVSLQLLTNKHFDCDQLLREILEGINFYYQLLTDRETAKIDQDYLSVLFRMNEWHDFKTEDSAFSGEIIGVNEIGQLLIKNAEGKILEFHFKEVEFQLKSH
jgi:BirA family biotin operon repressor/biotin-[acetyl-CoA-carboxylase] ligase